MHPAIAEIKLSPNRRFHLSLLTMIRLGIFTYILSSMFKITSYSYSVKLFQLPLAKLTLVFSNFLYCFSSLFYSRNYFDMALNVAPPSIMAFAFIPFTLRQIYFKLPLGLAFINGMCLFNWNVVLVIYEIKLNIFYVVFTLEDYKSCKVIVLSSNY